MSNQNQIKKMALATLFVFAVQVVFASFTAVSSSSSGHTNKNTESTKYSLKTISSFTSKGLSLNGAKYSFYLKAVELNKSHNGAATSSSLEFTKGNTTYLYPYKVKVKVPKFKAPTPRHN